MKNVILLFLCLLATQAFAQDTPSVLGIPFGCSYETCKSRLEQRYGKYNILEDKGVLKVYDISMGGFNFTIAEFEFQWDENNSYFHFARFSKNYQLSQKERAIDVFYLLKSMMDEKYITYEPHESVYMNSFIFGDYPIESPNWIGMATLEKSLSNGGEEFIYLDLVYGPIYYLDKSSDL